MSNNILPKVSALTFDLRYISDLAISTKNCLRSDLGQLNYPIPSLLSEIISKRGQERDFSYAPTFGHPQFLEVLKEFEKENFNLFDDGKILVTSGGQAGLFAAIHSIVGPGDHILSDLYCYPPYKGIGRLAEANFIQHDLSNLEDLKKPEEIKLLLLNAPSNPSGKIFSAQELEKIAGMARKHDWLILEDRVYDKIYFEDAPESIAAYCPERTLILNSASKNFAMPGIRIGWLYGPSSLIVNITKVHRNMNSCPNTFFQQVMADYIPLSDSFFADLRTEMKRRRDSITKLFDDLSWEYELAQGAIYSMVKIPGLKDSMSFAERMIREARVSAMPGLFFGDHPDQLRFCFGALDQEGMEELNKRLKAWI